MLPIIENTILNPVAGMENTFIEGIEVVKRNFLEIFHVTWQHLFYDYFSVKSQGKNCSCSVCNARDMSLVADDFFATFTQLVGLSSTLRV